MNELVLAPPNIMILNGSSRSGIAALGCEPANSELF
eukprot:CAMPEP_0185597144 /NCGR_PEP_ID=MMETSP0434-20130131/81179_1 /TAXON_ID=626734 ORGANISM="Favella taraikaensis, Strain Fe Narragansett Bay" /NCGR_SAMPLE_ID=MMETSP0434 /ASSEMBLY_ACC=CAM_ASM_000379 /LENGTH=35 /DNA_ID= /DNA_START= /DNA_END= /DNA_ORIENTATION=